jgi:ATP-dependent Clp protease ATP-binding subunit ClpA
MDKAHPEVRDLLLGLLDAGRLRSSKARSPFAGSRRRQ